MADNKGEEKENPIVRLLLMLLSPGANAASLIFLDIILVLEWVFILISMFYHYYNIHIYIIGILTTLLVIFVNYLAPKINEAITNAEEKKEE